MIGVRTVCSVSAPFTCTRSPIVGMPWPSTSTASLVPSVSAVDFAFKETRRPSRHSGMKKRVKKRTIDIRSSNSTQDFFGVVVAQATFFTQRHLIHPVPLPTLLPSLRSRRSHHVLLLLLLRLPPPLRRHLYLRHLQRYHRHHLGTLPRRLHPPPPYPSQSRHRPTPSI